VQRLVGPEGCEFGMSHEMVTYHCRKDHRSARHLLAEMGFDEAVVTVRALLGFVSTEPSATAGYCGSSHGGCRSNKRDPTLAGKDLRIPLAVVMGHPRGLIPSVKGKATQLARNLISF
jgi:hypothetical protein